MPEPRNPDLPPKAAAPSRELNLEPINDACRFALAPWACPWPLQKRCSGKEAAVEEIQAAPRRHWNYSGIAGRRAGALPEQQYFSAEGTQARDCRIGTHDRRQSRNPILHLEPLALAVRNYRAYHSRP